MYHFFVSAKRLLEKRVENSHWDGAREIIRELGKEALAENGDWFMLHRARPPEVPKG
jgi:hypothetical protein